MTFKDFKSDCHFSVYYALLRVVDELGHMFGLIRLSNVVHAVKDKWIIKYLRKRLASVFEEYKNNMSAGIYQSNAPIWVCWWTGEDTAPELVKQCICSIKKQAGTHPVYFINRNSYSQYMDIPDYILKKVENGQIGLAHLSDYIRVSLLAEYGGLWLDATIFCATTIPEEYFNQPIFTCKSETQQSRYISQMRWTTFVLGGWKGNVLYLSLKAAFEEYWMNEKNAIDYLFFDYLIELVRQEIPAVNQYMDAITVNNLRRDALQAAMNAAVSADAFMNIVQPDTVLYKLSWRENYSMKTEAGEKSIYAWFLENEI